MAAEDAGETSDGFSTTALPAASADARGERQRAGGGRGKEGAREGGMEGRHGMECHTLSGIEPRGKDKKGSREDSLLGKQVASAALQDLSNVRTSPTFVEQKHAAVS